MSEEKLATRYTFPESVTRILQDNMGDDAPDSITMRDAVPITDERAVVVRLREDDKRLYQREMVMRCVAKIGDKPVENIEQVEKFFIAAGNKVVELATSAWITRNQAGDAEVKDFINGAERVRA